MDKRRLLSFLKPLGRLFDIVFILEVVVQLLGLLIGLGIMGYLVALWGQHYLARGDTPMAAIIAGSSLLVAVLALFNVFIARFIVFGFAAVGMVAFVAGYFSSLVPR